MTTNHKRIILTYCEYYSFIWLVVIFVNAVTLYVNEIFVLYCLSLNEKKFVKKGFEPWTSQSAVACCYHYTTVTCVRVCFYFDISYKSWKNVFKKKIAN